MSGIDIKSLKGITQDSRGVKPGYLFAALPGSKVDGSDYIADAIRNGARVVLARKGTVLPDLESVVDVNLITVDNPRRELALMAAEFYKKQPGDIVAITGTNGKTSTVFFVQQLWEMKNIKTASLGTLGVRGVGQQLPASMTTPGPVALHAKLADLAAAGITHLAMEASSHGLDQYRLDGVKIKAAAFTNISHDHLDYHGDMGHYRNSKARLFTEVLEAGGTSVLNADSDEFENLKNLSEKSGHKVLSYGFAGEDLKLVKVTPMGNGQKLQLNIFGREYELTLPLVGEFQVMNALCALGLVLANDRDKCDEYVHSLESLHGVPGRLELVKGHPEGAAIYVDYAHTPDALKNILNALRPHTKGRLVCVFGCGGERDKSKRSVMGGIATSLADEVIVTDDNPRSENPDVIRADILSKAPGAKEIADRRDAIKAAMENLHEGDVLVIAGKGHEQGQVFADRTDPFDDVKEAKKVIEELKGK